MEAQRAIIYMIFVAILLTFAIVMIYNLMTQVDANLDFRIDHLERTSVAARLIYSPDCFALEEVTPCEQDKYQVHPAVLDFDKIENEHVASRQFEKCLHDYRERYRVYLAINVIDEDKPEGISFPIAVFNNKCSVKEAFPVILRIGGKDYNGKLTFCME